jgi:hypothetical protein
MEKVKGSAGGASATSSYMFERMKLSQRGFRTEPETMGKRLSPRRADREEALIHDVWPPLCACFVGAVGAIHQADCVVWRCERVERWLSLASVMEITQPYMAYTVSYLAHTRKGALGPRGPSQPHCGWRTSLRIQAHVLALRVVTQIPGRDVTPL